MNTHPDIVLTLFPLLLHWQSRAVSDNYISRSWPDTVRSAFVSQARIGWDNFLDGLLSKEWSCLQDKHYQSLGSRRLGSKWCSDFSKQLWIAVFAMWAHRNDVMHRTGKITEFSGGMELTAACRNEFAFGHADLDEIYHPYFDISRADFLKESTDYKRNWFSIIRQARENAGQQYTDLFATCQSSRDWVGLSNLQCS